jgi:hypothetical protein
MLIKQRKKSIFFLHYHFSATDLKPPLFSINMASSFLHNKNFKRKQNWQQYIHIFISYFAYTFMIVSVKIKKMYDARLPHTALLCSIVKIDGGY